MKFIVFFLASGFGVGYLPIAPGTAGSLIGLLCYIVFAGMSYPIYLLSIFAIFFLSIWVSGTAESLYGVKDDRRIVIDEILGILVGLAGSLPNYMTLLIGFLLFRFFDITKVFPANLVQRRLNGGLAVVMDDLVAGIYTWISLHIIRALM